MEHLKEAGWEPRKAIGEPSRLEPVDGAGGASA